MKTITFAEYDKGNINQKERFLKLFSDYLDEICSDKPEDNIPKHIIPRIIDIIGEEIAKYKEWLYLCKSNDEIIGFVLAQIDTPDNPMCKKADWGFIREFYITPPNRQNGFATQMYNFMENVIKENGANQIYLTASAKLGISFWEAMGYSFTGYYDEKNGNKIYEKNIA